VTGAAACSLFLDVEALFAGGAARWAATFFTGSRFTTLGFFGTPSPAVGVVGFGAGVSTLLATGHRGRCKLYRVRSEMCSCLTRIRKADDPLMRAPIVSALDRTDFPAAVIISTG